MILTLQLSQEAMKQTMFAMIVCRDSVKKGFKKSYGFLGARKHLETYDIVKEKFLGLYDEKLEQVYYLEFNASEVDMLASFLNFYIQEIKKEELTSETHLEILKVLENVFESVKLLDEKVTEKIVEEACLAN